VTLDSFPKNIQMIKAIQEQKQLQEELKRQKELTNEIIKNNEKSSTVSKDKQSLRETPFHSYDLGYKENKNPLNNDMAEVNSPEIQIIVRDPDDLQPTEFMKNLSTSKKVLILSAAYFIIAAVLVRFI
jgi:hypothetical protein